MSQANASGHGTDPRIHELVVESEDLQYRSVQIQDRASRTSNLIANMCERSHDLILRMQQAERPGFEVRLRDLRVCLERHAQCLSAVERSLNARRWSLQVLDREDLKASIRRGMEEVEMLAGSLQTMVHDAAVHIERELRIE